MSKVRRKLPAGIDLLPSGEYRARAMDANSKRQTFTTPSLPDATRWLDQQRAARARARAGLDEPPQADGGTLLRDLIALFRAQAAPAYASENEGYFLDRWSTWFGARRLSSIRDLDLIAWRDQRLAAGAAPGTIDRELSALKGIYKWAITTRRMRIHNPTTKITASVGVGAKIRPAPRRPVPGAVERTRAAILEHLEPATASRTLAVYDLARFTGMRRGDILTMRWEDLRLDADTPHVIIRQRRVGQVKSRERAVPLIPAAVAILRDLIAKRPADAMVGDLVIGVRARSVTQDIRRACNRAGIPPEERATLHPQRHEFVSLAREAGVPDAVLRAVIGHNDPRALQGYTKIEIGLAGKLLTAAMPSTPISAGDTSGDAGMRRSAEQADAPEVPSA